MTDSKTEEDQAKEATERDQRLRERGWNGTECVMCFVRREAIAAGTWDVGFRWCPHCATQWRETSAYVRSAI
jgi:hypothetical protein